MRKEIEQASQYAKRGHSFSFTAELLGMSTKRLRRILAAEGVEIQFPRGLDSMARRYALAALHEGMRGKPQTNPACLAALAAGREKMAGKRGWTQYTAFGVTGYVRELVEHFGSPVHWKTVQYRVKKAGMSIEDALTLPASNNRKGVIPPQFMDHLMRNRERAAARCWDAVRQRLMPTMLQYREPDHDIVVTAREGAYIEVEIRNLASNRLHSLRFLQSFESGVLFVFSPRVQDRIDFIAFEPNDSNVL